MGGTGRDNKIVEYTGTEAEEEAEEGDNEEEEEEVMVDVVEVVESLMKEGEIAVEMMDTTIDEEMIAEGDRDQGREIDAAEEENTTSETRTIALEEKMMMMAIERKPLVGLLG